jgi:hypothetical protein
MLDMFRFTFFFYFMFLYVNFIIKLRMMLRRSNMCNFIPKSVRRLGSILYPNQSYNLRWKVIYYKIWIRKHKNKKDVKRNLCKLYDKIIKMPSKSHETIPLKESHVHAGFSGGRIKNVWSWSTMLPWPTIFSQKTTNISKESRTLITWFLDNMMFYVMHYEQFSSF